jgi:glycine betaine/proline transport system ATP-binding protein
VLRKTIIFITHDFDEAIRVADRIAIMKDGAIIQIGTPEALVLDPASDYVAEFTRDIPRAKVLSARAIMRPLQGDRAPDARVSAHTKVEDLAATLFNVETGVAVVDEQGSVIGTVDRQAVLDVLVRKNGTV